MIDMVSTLASFESGTTTLGYTSPHVHIKQIGPTSDYVRLIFEGFLHGRLTSTERNVPEVYSGAIDYTPAEFEDAVLEGLQRMFQTLADHASRYANGHFKLKPTTGL